MGKADEERYQRAISDLLSASRPTLLVREGSPINENVDADTRRIAHQVLNYSSVHLKACIELMAVHENLKLAKFAMGRYPWHSTMLTKSRHLELTWFLFQNLCYKFKEKLKLVYNSQKPICTILSLPQPTWLKFELSAISVNMGKHIRERGNTVHEWDESNPHIDLLSMVELVHQFHNNGSSSELEESRINLRGHYQDSKWFLRRDARSATDAAREAIYRILEKHDPMPRHIFRRIDQIIDQVNKEVNSFKI